METRREENKYIKGWYLRLSYHSSPQSQSASSSHSDPQNKLPRTTRKRILQSQLLKLLKMSAFNMTSSSASTQAPTLFGRGGYNKGPDDESEDESRTLAGPINFGRGGYNKGPDDDDEEEDGRGGYN